eukprot:7237019-Prymnesium_polylepis.1
MLRLRGGVNNSLQETQFATLGIVEEAISNAFTAALPLISSQSRAETLRVIALRGDASGTSSSDRECRSFDHTILRTRSGRCYTGGYRGGDAGGEGGGNE